MVQWSMALAKLGTGLLRHCKARRWRGVGGPGSVTALQRGASAVVGLKGMALIRKRKRRYGFGVE